MYICLILLYSSLFIPIAVSSLPVLLLLVPRAPVCLRPLHGWVRRSPQEKGADVNAKDDVGQTALMKASWNGHTETAKFLVVGGEGRGTGGRSGV